MSFCSPRRFCACLLLVLCFSLSTAGSGHTQSPLPSFPSPVLRETVAETPKEPVSDTMPVQVRQAPLDPIVVFNTEGKRLVYLQGWNLEPLDEFWQYMLHRQQNAVPNFVLQEVSAAGKIVEDRAEVRFRMTWTATAGRTVLIPLGLKEGIAPIKQQQVPEQNDVRYRYTGPEQFELTVDSQTGQYVAVIKTEEKKKQEGETEPAAETIKTPAASVPGSLEFTLWFPLTRIGNEENKLVISFPQAVRSQFLLDIPAKSITATVSPGALLETKELPDQPVSQLKILGLKPDFELSWQKKKTETINDRPILFVEDSLIKVQLDVKSAVYDATLSVRSPSGEFDRFHIRLPQGTTLDRELMDRTAAADNFSWSEERSLDSRLPTTVSGSAASVIEIRLPRKVSSKLDLRIRATQQYNQQQDNQRDIEGFEVLEADRQTGYLSVSIPPDRRPNWETVRWVRRIETPDSGSLPALPEGGDTRFKFSSQPFLLRCRMITPETRINVKPEYQVLINKGTVVLTARLSYVVLGSKTEQLTVDLPGWIWNGEIKPSGIVDTVSVSQDKEERLNIPLRAPTDGNFEIELKAYRKIPAFNEENKYRLTIPLPKPAASWCESAPVVFVPGDNVEVIPAEEAAQTGAEPSGFSGLFRQNRRALTLRLDIPERQQEPLFYRSEPDSAVFVADIRYHRQKTAAVMQTQIHLHHKDRQVEQQISYDISYVSTDKLYFFVPKELEETGNIQVQQANKILDLRKGSPAGTETAPEDGSYQFVLLPDTQFKFQLVFRYSIPPVPVERDLSAPFSLSFIRPLETQITDHRVEMFVPNGYQITLRDNSNSQWKAVESQLPEAGTAFQSNQSADSISLLIRTADRDVLGTAVVDKAWMTTWLTGTARIDYGTYQVNTSRESVTLRLPQEAVKEKIFVYLDRLPVRTEINSKGELTIPLTSRQQNVPVKINVFYRFPGKSTGGYQELNLPHFDSADSETLVQCEYWQVVLPQNKHIIDAPSGWSAEYHWAWNHLFFGRVPSLRRQDIGLDEEFPNIGTIPAESNQYLFSSMNPPNRSSFYVMDRSSIIFLSSALVLTVGLLLIYFPKARYAGSLFALLTAFVAVLCYRPAPVLLMLQASSFGILLVLGSGYLYRIVYRNEKWVIPTSNSWDVPPQTEVSSVVMDDDSSGEEPQPITPEAE